MLRKQFWELYVIFERLPGNSFCWEDNFECFYVFGAIICLSGYMYPFLFWYFYFEDKGNPTIAQFCLCAFYLLLLIEMTPASHQSLIANYTGLLKDISDILGERCQIIFYPDTL